MIIISCENNSTANKNVRDENLPTRRPPVELLTCEKICNEQKVSLEHQDDGLNFLSFTNFGYMGVGRCRGHALLTQKFSLLASYDENSICTKSDELCLNDYKIGIEKIQLYKPHTFKGVSNLLHFSSIPEVKDILYSIVKRTSHKYSGGMAYIKNPNHENNKINYFNEIKRRLRLNHLPYVGLAGKLTGKHAVLIYASQAINNQDVLCARDPNVLLKQSESCENYFYINDSQVYYQRYGRDSDLMTTFKLTKDEDRRILLYTESLRPLCIENNRSRGLCK
jgi:hypothetical protein